MCKLDHIHLLVWVPPKVLLSDFVGTVKGRTAIRVFNKFRELKYRPYWSYRFWARGYGVNTVGLDEATIRAYVQYQERQERRAEQQGLNVYSTASSKSNQPIQASKGLPR